MASGSTRVTRHAPQLAAATGAFTLLCWLGAGPAAYGAPADGAPTPLPSSSATAPALRLPVMPSLLDPTRSPCTRASGTVMPAVPWAQDSLGLTRAHQLTSGAGVTVAVIDTGVSRTAPELAGRVGAAGTAGQDCVGHGTFIAGIIAAASAPGSGFGGVAPAARILAERGIGADGGPDPARVAAGIRQATDAGARVIDVSLAFPATTNALTSAVRYAAAHDVLVVAAGVPDDLELTSGATDDVPKVPFWPAAQTGVLSVVDVDIDGARPDGAVDPVRADLAAPGQGITGIGPSGRGHFLGNGPSIAAAFTSGAAALLRAYRPELTAPEVAARLLAAAYPAPVPRLDPYAALSAVLPAGPAATVPDATAAIHLHPVVEDRTPARRAYAILGGAALVALVLAAAALLRRKRRPGEAAGA
ncbi:S8 family serine peptidase [Streptomyces polygonati]|uniref:S8 family serine peptidase n=1 Tax=Streptomyces polygonati TaxID=1617087 RepID=A0ABV8HVJ4_9ACTN